MADSAGVATPASTDDWDSTTDYCTRIWRDALDQCRHELLEDDYKTLNKFESCDELVASLHEVGQAYQSRTLPMLLNKLEPSLGHVRNFTLIMGVGTSTVHIPTGLLWGLFSLIIELSLKFSQTLSDIVNMLEEMAHNLDLFRLYEALFRQDKKLQSTLVDVFVDVLMFWVHTARFLRRNPTENQIRQAWPDRAQKFEQVTERIRTRTRRMKERAEAIKFNRSLAAPHTGAMPAELLRQLAELEKGVKNNLNVSTAEDTDGPQLNNIPYPRNPNFFGREKELTAIGEHLDHVQGDLKFRSLALWGMGGIGKTQIALEYTRKREQDGLGAIFWVHSEKTIDMYQSFTAIAELLDLENRMKEGSGIQNQYLVTKWLQKARIPWLLVFDNVEDPNLVRRCWPASQYGSVLITSRNEVVSIDPAEDGLSVPVFSPLEGSQYLYSILKRKAYSDVEKESCEKLAARLDGLPLALTLMGTQIRTKHRKIQRFLDDYNKDYERHHKTPEGGTQNIFYRHSLETAYRTSFDGLNDKPHAAAILAVFSFLAPDSIPEELFEVTDASCLTSDLAFCNEYSEFEDALDPLLTSSLITRDSDDGTIRVHRLIQEEFRIYLSQKGGKERQSAFLNAATKLLCAVYPKSVNGLPLRNQWSQCKKYTPHVLALCGRFRELGAINRSSEELGEFMTLLTSCAWYLMECGSYSQFRELIAIAFEVCQDRESLDYAHLCMSAASMECERGNAKGAYPFFNTSFAIRKREYPADHEEIANMYNNQANIHLTNGVTSDSIKEAKRLLGEAMKIDYSKPIAESSKILHIRHLNMGCAHTLAEEYDDAWKELDTAQKFAMENFGSDCHFEAVGEFLKGNVMFQKKDWKRARKHYLRAHSIFERENDLHPSTSSAELKLGRVAIEENQINTAIAYLRKAYVKCQLSEPQRGDRGDSARVMRHLAKALALNGENEEAAELTDVADRIRKEVQKERYEEVEDSDYAFDLMVFVAFR